MDGTSSVTRRSFLSGVSGILGATILPQSLGTRQTETTDYPIGLPFEPLWEFNISDSRITSDATISILIAGIREGTIYLVEQRDSTSAIHALRRRDHETLWTTTHDRQLWAPQIVGEWLFVREKNRFLAFTLDAPSAAPEWTVDASYDFVWDIATSDEHVWFLEYKVDESGEHPDQTFEIETAGLHCYTLDGTHRWSRDTAFGEILYYEGLLIASAEQHQKRADEENYDLIGGHVEVRDTATGDLQWQSPDQDITRAVFPSDREQVIAVATDGELYGYDLDSGTEQWHHSVESEPADITTDGSRVYIGLNRVITAYNPATDEIEWQRQTPPIYDLTYSEQLLYLGDQNGDFHAFDAATGEPIWDHSLIGSGIGYEWVVEGTLYCVTGNWMAAFQGTKGKAIHQLRAIQDNSSLGAYLADMAGRGDAIATAQEAVGNENYETALAAVNRARTLQTVGDSVVWASGGALGYVGSRRATHEYKRRTFEAKVGELTAAYPISDGVLEGTAPDELITEATDVVEEFQAAWVGQPMTVGWLRGDAYADLRESVETATQLASRLEDASTALDGFPTDAQTEWEACLSKTLASKQYDALTDYLDQLETATELAELRETIEDSHTQLATSKLSGLMDNLLTPTSDLSETDIKYCETAIATIEEFQTSQATLASYDLDAVVSKLQEALEAASTKRDPAIRNFERLREILAMATTIESTRTNLDLQYLDLTSREIRSDLQHYLTHLDMDQLSELESLVENLDAGVWNYSDLQKFSPTEFEHLVAVLYDAQGYETEVSQASNDMGIDVIARGNGETLVIQVKQYSRGNTVGRPTVQQLAGARDQVNATKGVIITSSSFTDTAISASQSYGSSVQLIDGDELCTLLTQSPVSPPTGSSGGSGGPSYAGTNQQSSARQGSGSGHTGASTGGRTRDSGQSAGSTARSGVQYCMACGQGYRGNLKQVTDPSGETIYVCARCKELFKQTAAHQQAAKREAYDVLGIAPPVTQDEIKAAYREKVRETHPDTGGSRDEFLEVQQAYEALTESN